MTAPVLTSKRIIMRPPSYDDVPAIEKHLSDFEVTRMLAMVPHPYDPAMARQYVTASIGLNDSLAGKKWCIEIDGELAGNFAVKPPEEKTGLHSVGFWLGRPYWGKGYMTEALELVLTWGFENQMWEGIGSGVFEDNPASIALHKRLGFVEVERNIFSSLARGEPVPHIELLLTRDAWHNRQAEGAQ